MSLDLAMNAQIQHQKHKQKEKMDKLGLLKIKNFSASQHTINKVKRQPREWEETFVSHISDKELVSRIYKYLSK